MYDTSAEAEAPYYEGFLPVVLRVTRCPLQYPYLPYFKCVRHDVLLFWYLLGIIPCFECSVNTLILCRMQLRTVYKFVARPAVEGPTSCVSVGVAFA